MAILNLKRFAEKFLMGLESSIKSKPERGTSGIEMEFNIYDESITPVTFVGLGPERRGFADVFERDYLPEYLKRYVQLEVFHWMTEFASKPYYNPAGTAAEATLLTANILNCLERMGHTYGKRFMLYHGNLLGPAEINDNAVPEGWSLAKRRYLTKCVYLFGSKLATSGIHTNHSLPDSLLALDFLHLPVSKRKGRSLEDYRNDVYIRLTRLLRPFASLFIAISASTPLIYRNGHIYITENDSNRLLTFPNPPELDIPYLYRSHRDYIELSYDLIRKGIRFGNNNWTPVRARSDVEPVNRLIEVSSEQLGEIYRKGFYGEREERDIESSIAELVIENLCARVNLPMSRVEVRTDEGGGDLDLLAAKIAFKELLMLRMYADPEFGEDYTYGPDDICKARESEEDAARHGFNAFVFNPFLKKKTTTRDYLKWAIDEVSDIAEAMGWQDYLDPLREMSNGADNVASIKRKWFLKELGIGSLNGTEIEAPDGLVKKWYEEFVKALQSEVLSLNNDIHLSEGDKTKLMWLISKSTDNQKLDVRSTVRFKGDSIAAFPSKGSDITAEIVCIAESLIRIPSVTNCINERLSEVARCARFIAQFLEEEGLKITYFDNAKYPAILARFPESKTPKILLCGHFDVVSPDPDDTQFSPFIDGDYLWGRGSADMKTVVATYMVFMREAMRRGSQYPDMGLFLVGNEENGESEMYGTPHVLKFLKEKESYEPELMIVGERTGEKGNELFGEIDIENRGVVRFCIEAKGERLHTGLGVKSADIMEDLITARKALAKILEGSLTLNSNNNWKSTYRFSFLNVGEDGVYNITAGKGSLGVEIRPIPEDSIDEIMKSIYGFCKKQDLKVNIQVMEGGVACPKDNASLQKLISAVKNAGCIEPIIGKKMAGTSARFAPSGRAVVFGQSGLGPHSAVERHYIPSITPYFKILRLLTG